jgi:hypothetical protein
VRPTKSVTGDDFNISFNSDLKKSSSICINNAMKKDEVDLKKSSSICIHLSCNEAVAYA